MHAENMAFQTYNNHVFFLLLNRQNQIILLDTLDQEVTKFRECNVLLDLNSLVRFQVYLRSDGVFWPTPLSDINGTQHQFTEAKVYHNKLVTIRKEMILLHEKTTKLKVALHYINIFESIFIPVGHLCCVWLLHLSIFRKVLYKWRLIKQLAVFFTDFQADGTYCMCLLKVFWFCEV